MDRKHAPFSHAWAEALGEHLRGDAVYRAASARWEGALLLCVEADPGLGIAEQKAVFLDLHHGDCRTARAAGPDDFAGAAFVLTGAAATWREVLAGRLDPVTAAMRGKLRLARGSLARLLPHVESARRLLAAARCVDTAWPESWT